MSKSRSFFHSINSAWYTASGFNGLPLHPFWSKKTDTPKVRFTAQIEKKNRPINFPSLETPTEGDPHR